MSTDQEKIAWLRLARTNRIGAITFHQLLRRFHTCEKALEALPDLSIKHSGKKPILPCPLSAAEKEYEALLSQKGQLLLSSDKLYPSLLKHIEDPPPVLSIVGQLSHLQKPAIAIVGSRNASTNGCQLTKKIAKDLGEQGYIVTSGLARGIDTHAHHGSLQTGTIAILAGGVDIIYPKQNTDLYKTMIEKGTICSENPLGMQPRSIDFPRRNRIVSGLSQATVVVEAALKSGSLITARLAAEQGREVFAVPGSPLDPRSKGANKLIREGATLIENAEQIIEQLRSFTQNDLFSSLSPSHLTESTTLQFDHEDETLYTEEENMPLPETVPDKLHDILLEKLSNTPTDIDSLIRATDHSPADCLSALLDLELVGLISRHSGNKVSRLYAESNESL